MDTAGRAFWAGGGTGGRVDPTATCTTEWGPSGLTEKQGGGLRLQEHWPRVAVKGV